MRISQFGISAVLLAMTIANVGCASNQREASETTAAFVVPSTTLLAADDVPSLDYRIGPGDLLRISVFQVPELSFDGVRVDASGNIQLPLIGSVVASNRTSAQLAADIRERLATGYLRDPQVSITVTEAASQKVTVDGSVIKPGVYELQGRTTLLQAVAMAEGPTNTANLRSVAVFRTLNGRRAVAIFDLAAIRNGEAPDPLISGDDVVVVDSSRLSRAMREAIAVLPGLAVFGYF
jgi:polysaccharide export outer membrane protein